MIRLKNNQGFTIIEFMFFVLVGAIIVGGAYYVGSQKDKAEINNLTSKSSDQSADETSDWVTHTGNPEKYEPLPAMDGDGVIYTFKYPAEWKFYPRDTEIIRDGTKSTTSYQQIIPPGKSAADLGIAFYSSATNLNAEDYYKSLVGDQSGLVGPIWESVRTFTTDKGYSGHTAKLESTYSTHISNKKGVVTFGYSTADAESMAVIQQILDSVTIP